MSPNQDSELSPKFFPLPLSFFFLFFIAADHHRYHCNYHHNVIKGSNNCNRTTTVTRSGNHESPSLLQIWKSWDSLARSARATTYPTSPVAIAHTTFSQLHNYHQPPCLPPPPLRNRDPIMILCHNGFARTTTTTRCHWPNLHHRVRRMGGGVGGTVWWWIVVVVSDPLSTVP